MKMITAIIHSKDVSNICEVLSQSGYEFTKLATTGGFLKSGNTTLLIGVDDDKVESAIDLIRRNCAQRKEAITPILEGNPGFPAMATFPTEVVVGGAIVFVTDVSYFEKM